MSVKRERERAREHSKTRLRPQFWNPVKTALIHFLHLSNSLSVKYGEAEAWETCAYPIAAFLRATLYGENRRANEFSNEKGSKVNCKGQIPRSRDVTHEKYETFKTLGSTNLSISSRVNSTATLPFPLTPNHQSSLARACVHLQAPASKRAGGRAIPIGAQFSGGRLDSRGY